MKRLAAWFRRVSKPRDAEVERRLKALEIHIQELALRLNDRSS